MKRLRILPAAVGLGAVLALAPAAVASAVAVTEPVPVAAAPVAVEGGHEHHGTTEDSAPLGGHLAHLLPLSGFSLSSAR